jgi:hypothetical protein
MATPATPTPRCRIRVWFGDHAIADYCAEQAFAARYAAAMGRRFPSLHVTNEPTCEPAEPQDSHGR